MVESTTLAGQGTRKGSNPNPPRFPHYGSFWSWTSKGFWGNPRGFHLYKERERGGAVHTNPAAPPRGSQAGAPSVPPLPNPSYSLLLFLPRCLRRSAAGDLHHHRHHAIVLAGFQGGSTTSAARWNGEKDVVINTVRVTECGGAARLWHRQDLLRAFESGK